MHVLFVLKNVVAQPMNMFVLEFMFLLWSCYLCTSNWRYLSVPKFIFCTEVNISLLGYILLYWCIFLYWYKILAQPMNMFVY